METPVKSPSRDLPPLLDADDWILPPIDFTFTAKVKKKSGIIGLDIALLGFED